MLNKELQYGQSSKSYSYIPTQRKENICLHRLIQVNVYNSIIYQFSHSVVANYSL